MTLGNRDNRERKGNKGKYWDKLRAVDSCRERKAEQYSQSRLWL